MAFQHWQATPGAQLGGQAADCYSWGVLQLQLRPVQLGLGLN